jgi:orotate phosphoribosyltransferase
MTIATDARLGRILQEGHFRLSSGLHTRHYLQVALLLQDPLETALVCADLAEHFHHLEVEAVVGPAIGAIVPAYEVARALGARTLWTERVDGQMALRRSFALRPGERVLVVEDVITTGGSVREVVRTVEAAGGRVIGIGALVDRSGAPADFGVPFTALLSYAAETYAPADCPLCRDGVPLAKPGSRQNPPQEKV